LVIVLLQTRDVANAETRDDDAAKAAARQAEAMINRSLVIKKRLRRYLRR
jgi:hypothetical protein